MNNSDGAGATFSWPPASDKFRLLAGILLALFAVYGIAYLVVSIGRGWPQGFGDSFALWSWGRFVGEHAAARFYDAATLRAAQLVLGLDPGASYPFAYPPSFLLLLWPLGQLPGVIAFAALIALSLPLYLWATLGGEWGSPGLAAALAAPTTAIALVSGQTGFLAAALLAGGLRLADRPLAGGVLLGLLTYKPQLGVLVPVALVTARLWRTLVIAGATALFLIVLTSLVFGAAIWPSWAASVPAFSRQFAAESSEILHLMPTPFAALLRLGAAPPVAQALQWAATAVMAVIVWWLFRRGATKLAAAGLLAATPLATPYAFVYDLPIIATAVIWLVAERQHAGQTLGTGEVFVLMLAMAAPVALAAGSTNFPLAPLALMLLLGIVVRRCHRLRRQGLPGPVLAPTGAAT